MTKRNHYDNIERNDYILTKIYKELPPTSNARAAWEAISLAVENQRYELFLSAAESVGLPEWYSIRRVRPALKQPL